MWDQGAWGAARPDTDNESENANKTHQSSNIMATTVKQLMECRGDQLIVEGFTASFVKIVGLVREVKGGLTKVSMFVDDQTATIECVKYNSSDEMGNGENQIVPVGKYGRFIGKLRAKNGQKYINILKCEQMTDLNELTCHLLEVMSAPMKLKKLKPSVPEGAPVNQTTKTAHSSFERRYPEFTSDMKLVHGVIAACNDEIGIHRDAIFEALNDKIPRNEISKILEFFQDEGHVFFTCDDDHYRNTSQ